MCGGDLARRGMKKREERGASGGTEVESRGLPHSAAPAAREQTRGAKRLI